MTYDQFQRYSVLKAMLETFYSSGAITVLDVGGISPDREGRTLFLPIKQVFSGKSLVLDTVFYEGDDFIRGDGGHLPFRENSFDVVAALDVLEHIPNSKRDIFLKELCRVAGSAVFVSAPFSENKIENVEKLLFDQIKCRYGIEHQQLWEHRQHGLPNVAAISHQLAMSMPAGIGFPYGSLQNWLLLQSLKSCFMFRKSSETIHRFLDAWMTQCRLPCEFEAPFSRYFWFYSRDIPQKQLEKGIERIMEKLREQASFPVDFAEFEKFHKALVDFLCRDRVSVLVVAARNPKYLAECLNHVLIQKVDFDLEVAVWDIEGNKKVKRLIEADFPAVKYLRQENRDKTANALLKVFAELKGDFFLLVSEEIFLPSLSVSNFYFHLQNTPDAWILSPRIEGGRRTFRWNDGQAMQSAEEFNSVKARWISSECIFFKKEALFERVLRNNVLTKRSIFKWEKSEAGHNLLYAPQFTVYKK